MLRYLNMFVIIGLILIGVSLAGFATHDHFLMEPGQSAQDHLSLVYLGAGVLMLINGIVSIRIAPPPPAEPARKTPAPTSESANVEEASGQAAH